MKRALAGVAGVLLAVAALTGCGTGAAQPTKTVTKTSYQTQTLTKDQRFVNLIRTRTNVAPGVSDRKIVKTAHGFCNLLDDGYTARQILNEIVAQGDSRQRINDASFFFGASVGAYCPEYSGQVRSLGGTSA